MVLEDYFDFTDYAEFGEIRIQGHRIWMHDILVEHLDNGLDARQLLERFHTLNMEKIYACLLYFETNREAMMTMLDGYKTYQEESYQKALREGRVLTLEMLRSRVEDGTFPPPLRNQIFHLSISK